jgi:hypothetical protein
LLAGLGEAEATRTALHRAERSSTRHNRRHAAQALTSSPRHGYRPTWAPASCCLVSQGWRTNIRLRR